MDIFNEILSLTYVWKSLKGSTHKCENQRVFLNSMSEFFDDVFTHGNQQREYDTPKLFVRISNIRNFKAIYWNVEQYIFLYYIFFLKYCVKFYI